MQKGRESPPGSEAPQRDAARADANVLKYTASKPKMPQGQARQIEIILIFQ
jgi:hypothetical protein